MAQACSTFRIGSGVFIQGHLYKVFVLDKACDWDGHVGAGAVGDKAESGIV